MRHCNYSTHVEACRFSSSAKPAGSFDLGVGLQMNSSSLGSKGFTVSDQATIHDLVR